MSKSTGSYVIAQVLLGVQINFSLFLLLCLELVKESSSTASSSKAVLKNKFVFFYHVAVSKH